MKSNKFIKRFFGVNLSIKSLLQLKGLFYGLLLLQLNTLMSN